MLNFKLIPTLQNLMQSNSQSDQPQKIDRRDYGLGIKLWDDRDPRADQSFFLGGVPSFILSSDEKILDWNTAFDLVFDADSTIKKGSSISAWYRRIENFKRLPNRESQLFGDSLLPITDRNRVVYVSPKYGRMVFMKIMTPVLDRNSGRIIGWSISLNINSVTERVKFFEDLHHSIESKTKHSRYILGLHELAENSQLFKNFMCQIAAQHFSYKKLLVVGASLAPLLIKEISKSNPRISITVADEDAEALRSLKSKLGANRNQVKLVRLSLDNLSTKLPHKTFDSILILRPCSSPTQNKHLAQQLEESHGQFSRISAVSYPNALKPTDWWLSIKAELEAKKLLDLLKWHWPLVAETESDTVLESIA